MANLSRLKRGSPAKKMISNRLVRTRMLGRVGLEAPKRPSRFCKVHLYGALLFPHEDVSTSPGLPPVLP